MAIATKLLTLVCDNQFDLVVVLAGDGDFASALEYITESKHKQVWIVGWERSLSYKLKEHAAPDGIISIESLGLPASPSVDPDPIPDHSQSYAVGQTVLARHSSDGLWYDGVIAQVHSDNQVHTSPVPL